MKKASSKFNKLLNAIFAVLLAALGFSCSNGDEPCMYGTPHSDFEAKGTVVDENNEPVPNAKITIREKIFSDGTYKWTDDREYSQTTSDITGKYSFKGSTMTSEVRIVCTPPDDSLEADSTEMNLDLKGADGWFIGSATVEQNFKLKAKKD